MAGLSFLVMLSETMLFSLLVTSHSEGLFLHVRGLSSFI